MFSFGSGVLLGVRTDIATQTPVNFGLVQEVGLDLSFDTKQLHGQYQFPVALGRGKAKFTGKAKMAKISGLVFGTLFFGFTPATGQLATSFAESGSIPATPYQITASNGATFVDDLGVIYSATGLPFTKVSGGTPTVGQYKVSVAGVYTFAAADTLLGVLINYTYTTTGGEKIAVTNTLMGTQPTFQAQLYTTFQGQQLSVKLPNCVASKLSTATKLDDFMIPEMDFEIFADAAGNVGTWSFAEAS